MTTSALATAIERKNWDFVALCLLLGVAEIASTLPPETLEQLLDLLDFELTDTAHPLPLPLSGEGTGKRVREDQ